MGNSAELAILIRAKADLAAAQSAISKFLSGVEGQAERTASQANNAFGKMAGFGGIIAKGALAGGAALGALGGLVAFTGIKFDNMKQQAQIAFTTMLGSGEKAKAFLDELQEFAAKTPFEFPDLIKGSQRLLAMGFAAKDVRPTLTAVGDAVAGLGGGGETIDNITRALGQMQAKGKVSAEEMNQLAEAGIPGWQMIADKIGVSIPEAMKMAEKGAISADVAIGALVEGMNAKFGGMMEQQSHTFGGLLSTLKDTFTQVSGTIMGPIFERLTAQMERLVAVTNSPGFQEGVQNFANNLATGLEKAADAGERALDVLMPLLKAMDSTDVMVMAVAFGTLLVVALTAYAIHAVIATLATIGLAGAMGALLLGIPLIIAALILIVRHWDQIWPRLKEAPMAILNWLKTHWADVLIAVVAGPIGLIIKYWDQIWDRMPAPVQGAMNVIAGIVENVINGIIGAFEFLVHQVGNVIDKMRVPGTREMLDKIGLTSDLQDALQNWSAGVSVNFTNQSFGNGEAGAGMGQFGGDQFTKIVGETSAALDEAIPSFEDLTGALGGGGGAGSGGGLTAAVDQASQDFAEFAQMFQQWSAATGGTLPQFVARIEMMQRESELNTQIAEAQFRANVEAEKAADGAGTLRIALKELALEALKTGKTMTEVMRDAFKTIVDDIQGAFNGLFSRPTREQAQLNLEIALAEEERARRRAAGASAEELESLDNQIEALRNQTAVYDAHSNVLKAQMDAADQSLLTSEQQNFSALLYIAAMNTASGAYAHAADMAALESLAKSHYIDALNNAAGALGSGTSAADPFTDAEKHWINGVANSRGEPEPFPGYVMGTPFVPVDGPAYLHRGERVVSAADNREGWSEGGSQRPTVQHIHVQQLVLQGDPQTAFESLGVSI